MICNSSFIFVVQESFHMEGMKFLPECDNVRYGVLFSSMSPKFSHWGCGVSLGVIIKI